MLINANALYIPLKDKSVHCMVTSPPYFGLRSYNTAKWIEGDPNCNHVADESKTKMFGNPDFNVNRPSRQDTKLPGYYYKDICGKCGAIRKDEQIGLEQSPDEYVEAMCQVFDEVWRVLRDDGTVWLNLGSSYANKDIDSSEMILRDGLSNEEIDYVFRELSDYAKKS